MNASLDLARMLNLNLIRQEKRLGFNSSSEFIIAVNTREPGKQYIMLLQHFCLQAPKFQHFQLVQSLSVESSPSKKLMAFKSVINAATISLSQKQSSPDFYKEVNIDNNTCNNTYPQSISTDG